MWALSERGCHSQIPERVEFTYFLWGDASESWCDKAVSPFQTVPLSATLPRRPNTECKWNQCKVEPQRRMWPEFYHLRIWKVIRLWISSSLEKAGNRSDWPYPRISQLLSFCEGWVYFPESCARTSAVAQSCQKSQIFHSYDCLGADPPVTSNGVLNLDSQVWILVQFAPVWIVKTLCLGSWLRVSTDPFWFADLSSLSYQGHLVHLPSIAYQGINCIFTYSALKDLERACLTSEGLEWEECKADGWTLVFYLDH